MDHFFMILVTGVAIGGYVHKARKPELDKGIVFLCIAAIVWLVIYGLVELGRSTTVWFSGHAGDANPLTAILLGGAIAINMPARRKHNDDDTPAGMEGA